MKIILSPAKEMNLQQPIRKEWEISQEAQLVVDALKGQSPAQLQRMLKVSERLLEQNLSYLESFDTAVSYEAMDLYHGLAFRSLKQVEGWNQHTAYMEEHVRILSALYGAVTPQSRVKPYRLDVTMSLKVQGQSLKQYWKKRLPYFFEPGEMIVNLASQEFSELLDESQYEWIDVAFYEKKEGQLKSHSTISKKGRGLMAGWMMQQAIVEQEQLQQFDLDGYHYHPELSTEKTLSFVKKG